jgi:hypothetical protein
VVPFKRLAVSLLKNAISPLQSAPVPPFMLRDVIATLARGTYWPTQARRIHVNRGGTMKRLVTHFAPTLALLLGATAYAQQQPTAQDLVGTWKLISEKVKRGDQTTEPLGSDPLAGPDDA